MQSCVIRKKLRITEMLKKPEKRRLRLHTGKHVEASRNKKNKKSMPITSV